jgi:heptosyltransferase-1
VFADDDYRRILIVKPSSLGDVIHGLPTLAALRDRFPQAHIGWLVKRQWVGILERAEGLDAVWPLDPGLRGWAALLPRLRAARYELVVDLQGLLRSALLAWLSGCPRRIGFAVGREGSNWFYSHRVEIPDPEMHAVDRYLLLAAALGARPSRNPEFRLICRPGDGEAVAAVLRDHGLRGAGGWIAVAAGARWPTKRYPPESFAAVADRIQSLGLGPVAFIGGPEDQAVVAAVRAAMKTSAVDLAGATSLALLPALLASASLLVTNDSGPMHVAAAVGTRVVALFGPTSPLRTGPYGDGHRVLANHIPCSPCFSRRCRNEMELECLRGLSPETVAEAAVRQLAPTVAQ